MCSPFISTAVTTPEAPTFVIVTMLKLQFPLMVNRMPPCLVQGTLQKPKQVADWSTRTTVKEAKIDDL